MLGQPAVRDYKSFRNSMDFYCRADEAVIR